MTAFDEILGQPKAVKLLSRVMDTGRLAHAYLFTGPDGVGKSTTAKGLAAILLCQEKWTSAPCGRCPGCLKFASNSHPDFLPVRPDGTAIKIDQIRKLKKALAFPPLASRQRIILLEDVQTMRREAANSLLKTLEEPPPDNLIILIASGSDPLLSTIVSRCQVIPFYPLAIDLAAAVLMHINTGLDRRSALALASLTDGCPGRAETLETNDLMELREDIITALLNAPQSEAEAVETALILSAKTAELKNSLDYLLDLLRIFFKDAMLMHLDDSRKAVSAHTMEINHGRTRERWNLTQLSDMVEAVDYAARALAGNCNRSLVCDVLFLKLLTPETR